ncbi:MAG: alpha/beta fold hydrolase [Opitutae bacterium]|nr:alpha/beta fold hydrolase [Opitutae bacterium]
MIHALPGMGADHRMFPAPWTTLPDFMAHDWPRHRGESSLAEVARTIIDAYSIQDGDSLIGASLGGMVACEIAKLRRLRTLILIGSATHKAEINPLLACLHPLANVAPFDWLRFSASKIPAELAQMFAGAEQSFIRAMCAAIFQWEGLGKTPVQCLRIHGRYDLVIPPPAQADLLLNAGHLPSITHTRECVAFTAAQMHAR